MGTKNELVVPPEDDGKRVDLFISEALGISRAQAARLLKNRQAASCRGPIVKSYRVSAQERITVTLDQDEKTDLITPADLEIIYEDEYLIVINKPAWMSAHAGPGWEGPTVPGALLAMGKTLADSGDPLRPGIVHRLDAGTTGAMIVAKTTESLNRLQELFRSRKVTKIYHAVVHGQMEPAQGTIEGPIGRHPIHRFKMGIVEGGKPAITHYETESVANGFSLLKVRIETGRTHQIRVHLSAVGHWVFGDPFYAKNTDVAEKLGLKRQWLHASQLSFSHPITGVKLDLKAEYPADLQSSWRSLQQK